MKRGGTITLVEVTYLVGKGRLPAEARKRLVDALAEPAAGASLVSRDGKIRAAQIHTIW